MSGPEHHSELSGSHPRTGPKPTLPADDPRIVEVVEEYLLQLEQGNRPDRAAYLSRYPELSEAVAQCLEGLDLVHGGLGFQLSRGANGSHDPLGGAGRWPNPLGDFQIVRELASGGMGVVYEATQLSLGRRVALKVLPFAATFDARQLQRFKNEAQAAALLHHSSIVPIYAVGCERGVHFYAMQLIDGQSLAEMISQLRSQNGNLSHAPQDATGTVGNPSSSGRSKLIDESAAGLETAIVARADVATRVMPATASSALTLGTSCGSEVYFQRIVRLLIQAAEALEHAHQNGVVHRDIKPANLLVNDRGNLWITDFGLAQFQADTGLTRTGDLLGTVRYMSPEQTAGVRAVLDHRTDIYSLGATAYEMLTLEPVFSGETRQELLYQILHDEPRPPRSINKSIPVELETIVLKALSKSPADRYTTAAELAADCARYLDHKPILARRPSLFDRAAKWSRRHPSALVAGLAALVVIATVSLVSNWRIAQEQRQTEMARRSEELRANEAEARFQQARQAVDTLLQVSEEELAGKPMVQATRRYLLEIVLSFYQDFIEQRHGDAASQSELAVVQDRVKGILHELNLYQRDTQVNLLASSLVQTDLQLTPSQAGQLAELNRKWSAEREAEQSIVPSLDEDTRRRRFVEFGEGREQSLAQVLSDEQQSRLQQLAIQAQGLFAFKEPKIAQTLHLSNQQRAKIREIEHESFAHTFRPPPPHGRVTPPPLRHTLPNLDDAIDKVVKEVLTDEQVQQWHALIGPTVAGIGWEFIPGFGGPPFPPP